jgi:phosphohistidine swiveling domain-containing protein
VQDVGRGEKVFDHQPVSGTCRHLNSPDDVLALLDSGAEGVVALVGDAGATFLSPIYHELAAVVCTSGTRRSHIGIVSREFQLPCVMGVAFDGQRPPEGAVVEVDCSGPEGVVRA